MRTRTSSDLIFGQCIFSSNPLVLRRVRRFVALIGVAACSFAPAAHGQDDPLNKVHVTPPATTAPANGAPAGAEAPAASGKDVTKARPGGLIRMNVNLVLVPVTVTDPMNRLVTGLEKDDFKLYENNSEQKIKNFSSEDAP